MALDIYSTHVMLAIQEVKKSKSTFLRDRYFPTASEDIFDTEDVIVDYKDETMQTLAPVVTPNKGGIPVAREGYQTHTYTPPLVAPERTLTANQLLKRQAGENIVSDTTPQQREAKILAADLADLSAMIDLREEYMAAQVLLNNGYTLKQYADNYGSDEYVEKTINFYTGSSNPAVYTPSTKWDATGHDILADIAAMADKLTKRGLPASDLIVSGKVADVLLSDENILKLLDNYRFILATEVNPQEQANGSVLIAVLNVKGHLINVYSYTRQYRSEGKGTDGKYSMVDLIPEKFAIVTAPNMGRTAYGAIVQMDQGAESFTTYAKSRVPKVVTNAHDNTKTIIQQSRPIVMPKVLNSAISAQVLS